MNSMLMFLALLQVTPIPQDAQIEKPAPATTEGRQAITVDTRKLIAAGSTVTLLDVSDLLGDVDLPLPLDPKSDAKPTLEQRRERATVELSDMLKSWMKPPFDAQVDDVHAVGAGNIQFVGNNEQLAWTRAFLELQRRWKDFAEVRVHIFDAPLGTFRRLGIEGTTKTFDKLAELDALLARAQITSGVNSEAAPRLLTRVRQKASMSVLEQVAYVQEWRLEIVEPGPKTIAVPTVNVVQDGTVVEARTIPLDEHTLGLELSFTCSKVERPIPTKKIRLGGGDGQEVEIGLPVVNKVGLDTKVSLVDNGSFVLVTASNDEGREIAVTVTLHRVNADEKPR